MADRFPELSESDFRKYFPKMIMKKQTRDRMIKKLLNSVIAKYSDLSVTQIIDLRDTDKSRYFAQPCPIIINYFVLKGF